MKCTAVAHANIALVKYWGKRDSRLNLPAVGSVSVTLKELYSRTSVYFLPELKADSLELDGSPAAEMQRARVSRFLDIFREMKGLHWKARVISSNNFPTGAGLASSASAFAALAVACDGALQLDLGVVKLSESARRGSGSAARSLYGGFVQMNAGSRADGTDAIARQLFPETFWPLEVLIFITDEMEKKVASTDGMNHTAQTSPFYDAWVQSQTRDLEEARRAIAAQDFHRLGEVTEQSCLKMHGLAMSAGPGIIYWNSVTLALMHQVRNLRQKGMPVYFTIDAGPQVKVLCAPGFAGRVKVALGSIPGIKNIITAGLGGGPVIIGDH